MLSQKKNIPSGIFYCCLHVLAPKRYIGAISYLFIVVKGKPCTKYACTDKKATPKGLNMNRTINAYFGSNPEGG